MPQLANEHWRAVSFNHPVLAFLRAERHRWPQIMGINPDLVLKPNLNDNTENRLRQTILLRVRGGLLQSLPQDTRWFEVQFLRHAHLDELRVIGNCGWDRVDDNNELSKVGARKPQEMTSAAASWEPPILWGHSQAGPFTILEGNKRLTSYVSSSGSGLQIACYVGLSPSPCVWHLSDRVPAAVLTTQI